MAVTLTPHEANSMTGSSVSAADISDAGDYIEAGTGYTPDAHNTARLIGEGSVKRAWAIVAARLCAATVTDGTGDIAGETKADYSYRRFASGDRAKQQIAMETDLLAGMPRTLLQMPAMAMSHVSWRDG